MVVLADAESCHTDAEPLEAVAEPGRSVAPEDSALVGNTSASMLKATDSENFLSSMTVEQSWSSKDLAHALCDALVAKGQLKEKPAFIRTDREDKIAGIFETIALDGEKMCSFENVGPLEIMIRRGTNGEAWVAQVQDALIAMLPEGVASEAVQYKESLPDAVPQVSSHEFVPKPRVEAQQAPDAAAKIAASLTLHNGFFTERAIEQIEEKLDEIVEQKEKGFFTCANTVDSTAHRTKYFFGYGYSYGHGMSGREALLPPGHVDPIPKWVKSHVISPLVKSGLVPAGWIDSVVINDYRAGGSIVAHVDPLKLFARPILTATFFGSARLVFGASFDPKRTQPPIYAELLSRGSVLFLDGYAANEVTHGMRPEDLLGERRVSIVLRHVLPDAPQTTGITGFAAISDAERSNLIRAVQGSWRDPNSRIIYIVERLGVTVLTAAPDADKVSVDSYSRKMTWRLLPKEHGLVCNTGILMPSGVSRNRLEWRLLDKPKAMQGFEWFRLDKELSSTMLK